MSIYQRQKGKWISKKSFCVYKCPYIWLHVCAHNGDRYIYPLPQVWDHRCSCTQHIARLSRHSEPSGWCSVNHYRQYSQYCSSHSSCLVKALVWCDACHYFHVISRCLPFPRHTGAISRQPFNTESKHFAVTSSNITHVCQTSPNLIEFLIKQMQKYVRIVF